MDVPASKHSEACLLSCVMRGGKTVRDDVADAVTPAMFYHFEDEAQVILSVAADGNRPDADTVKAGLDSLDVGTEGLEEVDDVSPAPQSYEEHTERVIELYGEREFFRITDERGREALNGTDVTDAMGALENDLSDLSRTLDTGDAEHIQDTVRNVLNRFEEEAGQDGVTGIPTGLPKLDRMTQGWQDSNLIVIAGRPSMGKSAFALSQALHAAVDEGLNVVIFSLEMSREEIVERMIAQRGKVNVRDRPFVDEQWQRIARGAGTVSDAGIWIDDDPQLGPKEMRTRLRRHDHEHGVDLAILDYLQLQEPPRGQSFNTRNKEVGAVTRQNKITAKQIGIPVLALAQLNRSVETRTPPRPQLSDLRDSGEIEEHADLVSFLYRPYEYGIDPDMQGNPTQGVGQIIVSKQRNGPTGTVKAAWVEEHAAWEPLEDRRDIANDDAPF